MLTVKNAELDTVCGITSKLPVNEFPELAFAGRSNVGKSSLINTVLCRKKLARTSAEPGKTRTINYYKVRCGADYQEEDVYFYLVDLPGYGYANVSVSVKEKWGKMIEKYLRTSKQLKAVFLLIDIGHEPSANDAQMYNWVISTGYDPIIICTKLDKINRSQIQKQLKIIREKLGAKKETVMIPFSAETKQGRDEIYKLMDAILTGEDPSKEEE